MNVPTTLTSISGGGGVEGILNEETFNRLRSTDIRYSPIVSEQTDASTAHVRRG